MKSFKDLEAWKKARELRKEISSLSKTFPIEEKYKLSDQIVRAARSVTANIAEVMEDFIIKRIFSSAELREVL